jgi:hypothetical protein
VSGNAGVSGLGFELEGVLSSISTSVRLRGTNEDEMLFVAIVFDVSIGVNVNL